MGLISKKDAQTAGLKRYFTGQPCLHGHLSERLVSNRACIECANAKRRIWSAKNPDKANAQKRNWCAKNREHVRGIKRAWNKAHPEGQKARARRWFLANKDRANGQQRNYAKRNPGKIASKAARRRSDLLLRTPAWADLSKIEEIYARAVAMRANGYKVDVDHVIPLCGERISGLHVAENLQIIDTVENQLKSNQFAI